MNGSLYLFNPDHDLVLANGDENFNPPRSARNFGIELACLPLWYGAPGSVVLDKRHDLQWVRAMQQLFPQLAGLTVVSQPDFQTLASVQPWGWNAAVRKGLLLQGASATLLPDSLQLEQIRNLSHRNTAISAMKFLQEEATLSTQIPTAARFLAAAEAEVFAAQFPEVVFKAPWSGSGKGIRWARSPLSKSQLGWLRNIAEKQGGVIGEVSYEKVQDFAMEFLCDGGRASFAGYSLFSTERGVYKGNELSSDETIFKTLTDRWIPEALLIKVQQRLLLYIEMHIAPFYQGPLGADMFVFRQKEGFRLHPCVEINLRMTMGRVARVFHDRFVQAGKTGGFFIDHFPVTGTLWKDHLERQTSLPLHVSEGRITEGYLSLSPLSEKSHYRARVEIFNR